MGGFCQVVEAETFVSQAGAPPRSYPSFKRPAPYLLCRPNSGIASPSLRGTPTRTADAVAGAQGEARVEPDAVTDACTGQAVLFVTLSGGWRGHGWLLSWCSRSPRGASSGLMMSWRRKESQQV